MRSQSNPAGLQLTAEQTTDNRFSTISTMTNDTGNDTGRKSTSSTISSTSLTQVSDISDEAKVIPNVNVTGSSQVSVKDTTSGQVSTTDVVLDVQSDTNNIMPSSLMPPISHKSHSSNSDDESPPPLPSSEPPAMDDDIFKFQSGKKLSNYFYCSFSTISTVHNYF